MWRHVLPHHQQNTPELWIIRVWFEGTFKDHLAQAQCYGQGHQVAEGHSTFGTHQSNNKMPPLKLPHVSPTVWQQAVAWSSFSSPCWLFTLVVGLSSISINPFLPYVPCPVPTPSHPHHYWPLCASWNTQSSVSHLLRERQRKGAFKEEQWTVNFRNVHFVLNCAAEQTNLGHKESMVPQDQVVNPVPNLLPSVAPSSDLRWQDCALRELKHISRYTSGPCAQRLDYGEDVRSEMIAMEMSQAVP